MLVGGAAMFAFDKADTTIVVQLNVGNILTRESTPVAGRTTLRDL
jgi:hypothetical protein